MEFLLLLRPGRGTDDEDIQGRLGAGSLTSALGTQMYFTKKHGHQRKAWSSWDYPPLYNLAGTSPYSPKPTGGEGAVWLGLKGFGASGIAKFELKGTMSGKRPNGSAQHGRSSRLRDLAS